MTDMGAHTDQPDIPKNEYPRPQFRRQDWMNLNGKWEFGFDDKDAGKREKWYLSHPFSRQITVPVSYTHLTLPTNSRV